MRVLVTGGAGYIGSHTVRRLLARGHEVTVVDDLSHGRTGAAGDAALVVGDVRDAALLRAAMAAQGTEAILHFAALKSVEESFRQPGAYFSTNVGGTLAVLEAAVACGVGFVVHSSTCAVYGNPASTPVGESAGEAPTNPYGESKLQAERVVAWFGRCHGLRHLDLRYFNAAGASDAGGLGESLDGATNLIPIVLGAALRHDDPVRIFGTDHPTPDGTALRDYVHVDDLAEAHVRALDVLRRGGESGVVNLGTGRPTSVGEVIAIARSVTGRQIPTIDAPRRPGDPSAIWADASKARRLLGWTATRTVAEMIESAWAWHRDGEPGADPALSAAGRATQGGALDEG
jgi:UDP-glucose-4-epimerase GalE